jgi:S1-C subfamily serine protease
VSFVRRCFAIALWLSAEAAFAAGPQGTPAQTLVNPRPPPRTRVYEPMSVQDNAAAAKEIRRRVAYLKIEVEPPKDQVLDERERDGYGVVLEPTIVATVAQLLDHAKKIEVLGPDGGAVQAEIVVYDLERRVGVLKTKSPLSSIGLVPAEIALSRRQDDTAFALVSTLDDQTVFAGFVLDPGETPEYGFHVRTSLVLKFGMPAFDDHLRLLGVSRTLPWDADKQMLITPEMIAAARSDNHR